MDVSTTNAQIVGEAVREPLSRTPEAETEAPKPGPSQALKLHVTRLFFLAVMLLVWQFISS
ncbi:MAG: hypothetical protein KGJ86_21485, partial [Chloroflexota bacterium]|nr:hypothetical protein [Chloroflexota bacterium]